MGKHTLAAVPADDGEDVPSVETLAVTPTMAREFLATNTLNRNVRQALVEGYSRDMARGSWLFNGESIKFDVTGRMVDGQHRCLAVIKANVTVTMLVIRGLPEKSWDTIDIGAPRTYRDALGRRGESSSATLAAICRRALMWERGQRTNVGTVKPTHAEMDVFLSTHPEVRRSAEFADRHRGTSGIPGSVLGLAHWVLTSVDHDAASEFLNRIADGVGLPGDSPILAFRNRLTKERDQGGRIQDSRILALLIHAWNAYAAGEARTKLLLKSDEIPDPRRPKRNAA